jgi:short-subunit dehydrogenase
MREHRKWERALVTGASEGIGEAFARELAQRGADLVIVARRRPRLERLAAELASKHDIEVEVIAADLTDAADLARVESRIEAENRPIDLLINNAGGATENRPFIQLDRGHLAADAYLNSLTLLRLTHAAVQTMASRGRGNVLNVSAGVAFYPLPGAAAYAASKAFVNSLSEALDYELRGIGVRVSVVCPGFTRTGAQARLGLHVEGVPRALWTEPKEVAVAALRAATRGRPVCSVNTVGALSAAFGRHLPRRLWMAGMMRGQARLIKP